MTSYPAESAGGILSTRVLTTTPAHTLRDVLQGIADERLDDIQHAYVLDADHTLIGVVDLALLAKSDKASPIRELMSPPRPVVHAHADQEKVVLLAIEHDTSAVPVVDDEGHFLGAVIARRIIDIMHQEHLEDALLSSGIRGRGSHILKLATSRYKVVIAARAPWLIFGAVVGLGLGFVSSLFEETLAKNVAVAYFVPVVAYIADSVGTQSEAITVRALATLKMKRISYMVRELVVGLVLGGLLGTMGAVGAALISHSAVIGLVVGVALFMASAIAAVLASFIPITFKALGKDPALGSGPLATALQDLLSVLIYFVVAMALL